MAAKKNKASEAPVVDPVAGVALTAQEADVLLGAAIAMPQARRSPEYPTMNTAIMKLQTFLQGEMAKTHGGPVAAPAAG